MTTYDPGSFFTLHDFDSSGEWTADEIARTYGLDDEGTRAAIEGGDAGVETKRREVVAGVLATFDEDGDGRVSRSEWLRGVGKGQGLRDFGVSLEIFLVNGG